MSESAIKISLNPHKTSLVNIDQNLQFNSSKQINLYAKEKTNNSDNNPNIPQTHQIPYKKEQLFECCSKEIENRNKKSKTSHIENNAEYFRNSYKYDYSKCSSQINKKIDNNYHKSPLRIRNVTGSKTANIQVNKAILKIDKMNLNNISQNDIRFDTHFLPSKALEIIDNFKNNQIISDMDYSNILINNSFHCNKNFPSKFENTIHDIGSSHKLLSNSSSISNLAINCSLDSSCLFIRKHKTENSFPLTSELRATANPAMNYENKNNYSIKEIAANELENIQNQSQIIYKHKLCEVEAMIIENSPQNQSENKTKMFNNPNYVINNSTTTFEVIIDPRKSSYNNDFPSYSKQDYIDVPARKPSNYIITNHHDTQPKRNHDKIKIIEITE